MSNILDSKTKEIPESAEYMYKEIQEIMYEDESFYDGKISIFQLYELFHLINCKNYQKSTLYIELLEKFCKNEMNPSICFDIIIDYEKNSLNIIPKISESFIYNLKKILIEKEKNKENSHFANITLESATIFLSEFKKIVTNMDNAEFEEHFLEISAGISFFDKHKEEVDSMIVDNKIKWMIGASFYRILKEHNIILKTNVNTSQNNSVILKPENKIQLELGLDPRVKINIIGGEQIRFNGFLKEELEELIQEVSNEFKYKIEEITIGFDFSNKANLSKEQLLEIKEAREEYYGTLLEQLVISNNTEIGKEEGLIILNSLSHFYDINNHYSGEKTTHSEIKKIGFNKFLIEGVKRQLKKKVGEIFKDDTLSGIAGLILRNNFAYAEGIIADYLMNMILQNKETLKYLEKIKNIHELTKKIKGTAFEFLTYYESNISRNNVGGGLEHTPLLISTEIMRLKYPHINPNDFTSHGKEKTHIIIDKIEIFIKIIKECLDDTNPKIVNLVKRDLFNMLKSDPKKRPIKYSPE